MAPAPKTRIKTVPSADAAKQAAKADLIDLSEAANNKDPAGKVTNGDKSKSETIAGAPKTTFLRRSSAGAEGINGKVSVRGNVDEMREHLKHLGPSNLASRPKTTRYDSVKIKPARQGTIRRDSKADSLLQQPIIEESYIQIPAPQGGEGEGLLKSAGKDAKDGVQAVQQGYGSFGASHSRPQSAHRPMPGYDGSPRHDADSSMLEIDRVRSSSRPSHSNDSDESTDTLGSMQGDKSRTGKRAARSGSITENVVEARGVRKVVLETNDSSSPDDDEAATIAPTASDLLISHAEESKGGGPQGQNDGATEGHKKKQRRKRSKKKAGSGSAQ